MSTISELNQPLHAWIRRLRMQRALAWSLRGFIVGLLVSLAVGSFMLYQAKILRVEFLALVLSASLLAAILFGLTAALWRIRPLDAARRFDLLFHLDERVSTAVELTRLPSRIPPEILDRQLADAVTAARKVNPRRDLPLRAQPREGLIALLCVALIALVWFRGEAMFQAAQQARAVEQAVQEQVTQIEEIIQQIEANETLTEEQKQALTDPLKEAQQALQDNPSLENSVSTLTNTGEQLQALSDPQAQQMGEALKEAGNQLANQNGSPLESVGEQLAQGNTVNAATELANMDISQLSAEEQAQLADQLNALAESLQSTNPELASQLNQAAEALQNGDTASAQQALNQAAQSLAQAGQQVASSQAASQAASQLQQGAGQVLAAGGGGQQASQTNQGGQNSANGGAGSGSGNESGESQSGNEAGSDPIAQNNGPGDGGESTYEQIYAPQLLGGEGGEQVNLPPSNQGGDVIGQGPTTPGEPGASTVPYNEVFSQYEQVNNEAIESGAVPPSFIQIVKNYFDSLKP
ncbi:MAG: hypothetical protein CNIPEHKO_02364 [Anaerolineales bacterium]|nr:hypothetical protein [Anaerolineales bacterium]